MSILTRLARLETTTDAHTSLRHLTDDELQIRLWDLCRSILRRGDAEAEAELRSHVRAIEAGIIAQARMRQRPEYGAYIAQVQGCRVTYVPAVCGDAGRERSAAEYTDLHRPDIMERRAAILARADVRALIAEAVE